MCYSLKMIAKIIIAVVALGLVVSGAIFLLPQKFDFGDAPDPTYPSLLESNGARHKDVSRARLGDKVDKEKNSHQVDKDSPNTAIGPDDGFDIGTQLIRIHNNDWPGVLYLNVLVDWNQDGDWEDEQGNPEGIEWYVQNQVFDIPLGQTVEFVVPSPPPAMVFGFPKDGIEPWTRITLTDVSIENYVGRGKFDIGETEDYVWIPTIGGPPIEPPPPKPPTETQVPLPKPAPSEPVAPGEPPIVPRLEPPPGEQQVPTEILELELKSTSFPPGRVGVPYSRDDGSTDLQASGGVLPYRWSVASGTLPPGISIDPDITTADGASQAQLTGTPQFSGTYFFDVVVTDARNATARGSFSIVIEEAEVQREGEVIF